MHFYWFQDRKTKQIILVYWIGGTHNLGDYGTKRHPEKRHILVRPMYVINNETKISNMYSTAKVCSNPTN